jgi:enoyl-CoA hydratase/carnithine racemase
VTGVGSDRSPTAGEALVSVVRDGVVAVVTLTREAKLNALSSRLEGDLIVALESPEVASSRCVVITGGTKVFSAGADVTELEGMDVRAIFDYYRSTGGVYERLAAMEQPSISAISGYCLGGGLELALATDFRIADASAVFGLPEVSIGIVPSSGGIHRLVRMFGTARARELVVARPRFSADEAARMGIVTEVVPAGAALGRACELARTLSELPALACALALRSIDAAAESSRDTALFIEQLAYAALAQAAESRRST